MFDNYLRAKITKEDRDYIFICSPNSPLGEVHDVLAHLKQHVVDQIIKQQEKEASHGEPQVSPSEV